MSQIIATTLSNGSVSVPTATVVNGSAKAWVNLNGTGTIALRGSFNTASVTDIGTGQYQFHLTASMLNPNYSVSSAGRAGSAIYGSVVGTAVHNFTIGTLNGGTFADSAEVHGNVQGDLA